MIDCFSNNFWFDWFSYKIDYRSNLIYHFEKIGTTAQNKIECFGLCWKWNEWWWSVKSYQCYHSFIHLIPRSSLQHFIPINWFMVKTLNACPRTDISQVYFLQKRTNPKKQFPKTNCWKDISQIGFSWFFFHF